MPYTRDHVETYGYPARPAVNIKIDLFEVGDSRHGSFPDALLRDVAADTGADPDRFVSWWRNFHETDEDAFYDTLDAFRFPAAEDGFEDARQEAEGIFPHSVDIWQEGRSGGWLTVHGLPDLDSWDAVALGRWRRFERAVQAIRDDHPRQVAWLIAANRYEADLEQERAACRWQEQGRWEHAFSRSPLAGMTALDNSTTTTGD